MSSREVNGLCPMGCGRTLFVGTGGRVTCSFIGCEDPGKADYELNRPLHLRIDAQKAHESIMSQASRIAELEAKVSSLNDSLAANNLIEWHEEQGTE